MNKRILSIGFIVAIIFAVTAFPTGNGLPTGIGNENQVVNGCTCHTGGENGNVAIILQDLHSVRVITLTDIPSVRVTSKRLTQHLYYSYRYTFCSNY